MRYIKRGEGCEPEPPANRPSRTVARRCGPSGATAGTPTRRGSARRLRREHEREWRLTHADQRRADDHDPAVRRAARVRPPAASARPIPGCTPTSAPASPSCSRAGGRSSPTTWASARPAGDRRRPRGRAGRPVPRDLPRRGEAELAARDRARRARRRRAGAPWQGRVRPAATVDGRQLRPPRSLRGSLRQGRVGRRDRRRGALHQERLAARVAGAAARRRRRRGGSAGRLPAHRDADDEPAPRPLQPPARRAPPAGRSFYSYAKRYCAAFDNGYGLDSRGASNVEELAKIVSGVMLRRAKTEALDLPPKTRTWQPVEVDGKRFRQQEARALAFYEAHPDRSGPDWARFLGLLTQARQGLAVAKVGHTLEAVRERLDPARRSSSSRRSPSRSRS